MRAVRASCPSFVAVKHVACALAIALLAADWVYGQIPQPDDAPRPLSAERSCDQVELADGFELQLVACEPLTTEPSGIAWDEAGRLFVCELHGYNLEGQFDIDALNQTGQLDRVVRRIQANPEAKQAALDGTFGVIKQLIDHDGDGRMDAAEVWADDLPPCYGICPARGGLIVACAPDIVYLADRDEDGRAEVRETLFTGFDVGALERGINCPGWGPDGWIYLGRGHGGGTIRGPHLPSPVVLPDTDFRIRSDGTAIEPVTGGTHTFGWTFTSSAERFVISTRTPGIFVAPMPWRYLMRHAEVRYSEHTSNASAETRVYPVSEPHPWRRRRASDPGFARYYTERYGHEESAPNGYFTSACAPLVYQDSVLPSLQGQLLACEPAQNLIHRALVLRDGLRLRLQRPAEEQQREFLASKDGWFHPISLTHGPDGAIYIVDFYREIIEDYSAIPRYLQQEYGLVNGREYGRIWRLVEQGNTPLPIDDLSTLSAAALAQELDNERYWRRLTAQRLLIERQHVSEVPAIRQLLDGDHDEARSIAALYTLNELGKLSPDDARRGLQHPQPGVRVHALRLIDQSYVENTRLHEVIVRQVQTEQHPAVLLQLALSVGEGPTEFALAQLQRILSTQPHDPWMIDAVLSSLAHRAELMVARLLGSEAVSDARYESLFRRLAETVADGRDGASLSDVLVALAACDGPPTPGLLAVLQGLNAEFVVAQPITLTSAGQFALTNLTRHSDETVGRLAAELRRNFGLETDQERSERLAKRLSEVQDPRYSIDVQEQAVRQLAVAGDPSRLTALVECYDGSSPRLRSAIVEALFANPKGISLLLTAVETERMPAEALTSLQRAALREHADSGIRRRAESLLSRSPDPPSEQVIQYFEALHAVTDAQQGEQIFRDKCATCHQAHGIGFDVGPGLDAEFRRAPETIVRDVLLPSEKISAGFQSYAVQLENGRVLTGILQFESAGRIELSQPDGKRQSVRRQDIESMHVLQTSLMPDDFAKTISPPELAQLIAWLRRPPTQRILFGEDRELLRDVD